MCHDKPMLERDVEKHLKALEGYGFAVYKFSTSHAGTMDRLILWPTWSPAPPVAVEIKRPGKSPRALQDALAADWRARGFDVRPYCDTIGKVTALCDDLLVYAVENRIGFTAYPTHISNAYVNALKRIGR